MSIHRRCSPILAAAIITVAAAAFSGIANAVDLARLQYGEQNRYHVTLSDRGEYQAALDYARSYLVEHPDDLEALYILAMAQSNLGMGEAATRTVQRSLDKGLTLDRYLAGPRELLAPLYRDPSFQELRKRNGRRLVHGPVLGSVTDHSAQFWVRTDEESSVTVSVNTRTVVDAKRIEGRQVAVAASQTRQEDDYTTVVEVLGLSPATHYTYFLSIDGTPEPIAPAPTFTTYPSAQTPSDFDVVFGGGAGFIPWNERIWTTLASRRPAAALLLGDNVYIDTPESPATQRYCYYRRQSRPEYRRFAANTPIYAIWDDHDFGTNDCVSSQSLTVPPWKMDVLKVFRENFANPAYGSKQQPGCFFDFSIGDVDFFMLDCRFFRQNPKTTDHPSMLGPNQKAWLLGKLRESQATFKVIASSVPWATGTKPGSRDTWDGFPEEREEIFAFLDEHGVSGVVLLSADRHRSDAWKIDRPSGYDLYEFSSSKLTNAMSHPLMKGSLFGYNEKCSFGLLSFRTQGDAPSISYRIVDIDGNVQHAITLDRKQLSAPD